MLSDFIYKHKTTIGIILTIIIGLGAFLIIYTTNRNKEGIKTTDDQEMITVDIEGAVKKPGVYSFKAGSVIQDAVNAAEGLSENVDNDLLTKNFNLAEALQNNQKISIPIRIETAPAVAGTAETQGKININTASLTELDSLPGIGPVYAQRIIDYRTKKTFNSIEEIKEIQGIGEKTFEKFKDLIMI